MKNLKKFKLRMNRRAVSPVIATLLLIAIAVAASVVTYSWVMSMTANQSQQGQTSVKVDQVLFGRGPIKTEASTMDPADAVLGTFGTTPPKQAAHLTTDGTANAYAYVKVYPTTTITLSTLTADKIPTFKYEMVSGSQPPALELRFTQPNGDGYVDVTVFAYGPVTPIWPVTTSIWHDTAAGSNALTVGHYAVAYGVKSSGIAFTAIETGSNPLSTVISGISGIIDQDPLAGAWVLTRVTPQIGWLPASNPQEVYIADVTVDDVLYPVAATTAAGNSGILLAIRNSGSIAATIDTGYIFQGDNLISTVGFISGNVLSAGEAKNLGITDAEGSTGWSVLTSGGELLPAADSIVAGNAFNLVENTPYKIRIITSTGFVAEGTFYSPGSW